MKKRISLILCIVGLMGFTSVYGQNEKFKALFLYNFTNYIEWPGGTGSTFVIAVYGDSPIITELQSIARLKKVGSASIEVKKINSIAEIGKVNMIFIPASKKRMLVELNQALSGKAVLIVSDNATGEFGINFIEIDSKQSFQISKSNIERHRLKVNSLLLTLGVSVN